MDFQSVVNQRHSYRSFKDDPIPAATLQAIIADAQRAPSWANAQPWQVMVVTGDTLATIKAGHRARSQRGVAGNADLTVAHRTEWTAASRRNIATWNGELSQFLLANGTQASYAGSQDNLFNAPALVYLILRKPVNDWAVFDLGAFSQTLMLSATAHGVQSIPAYEIIRYPAALRKILNVDNTHRFIMGIALGYRDSAVINDFRSSRTTAKQFVTFKK